MRGIPLKIDQNKRLSVPSMNSLLCVSTLHDIDLHVALNVALGIVPHTPRKKTISAAVVCNFFTCHFRAGEVCKL